MIHGTALLAFAIFFSAFAALIDISPLLPDFRRFRAFDTLLLRRRLRRLS